MMVVMVVVMVMVMVVVVMIVMVMMMRWRSPESLRDDDDVRRCLPVQSEAASSLLEIEMTSVLQTMILGGPP